MDLVTPKLTLSLLHFVVDEQLIPVVLHEVTLVEDLGQAPLAVHGAAFGLLAHRINQRVVLLVNLESHDSIFLLKGETLFILAVRVLIDHIDIPLFSFPGSHADLQGQGEA